MASGLTNRMTLQSGDFRRILWPDAIILGILCGSAMRLHTYSGTVLSQTAILPRQEKENL